jgi:spermidine/putrescine transport system ATP-binding protein
MPQPLLELIQISRHFVTGEQTTAVLKNINLTIYAGEIIAIVGASGSGKSTLMNILGCLDQPSSGIYKIAGQEVGQLDSDALAKLRREYFGFIFQHYHLVPHLSALQNTEIPAVYAGIDKASRRTHAQELLKRLGLGDRMEYLPNQLSGGQQQRVALARAIINEPEVLLLDEPLAALDLKLRERMLLELIELQDTLKTTFVYVTHDQFEALTVADLMAIMNQDGEIEQVGTPKQVYEFPVSTFVAKFVGTTNIFQGILQLKDGKQAIAIEGLGELEVIVPQDKRWIAHGNPVFMSLRPEKIEISKKEEVGFSNHLKGMVHSIVYHGRSTQYNVRLKNGQLLQVFEQNEEHFPQEVIEYDDEVNLYWQKENIVLLEK